MKVVILAGGMGTRILEESQIRPKALIEAGGKPLIWHVMKNYSEYGFHEFVILVGFKGDQIRDYFANFWLHQSDITFDLQSSTTSLHQARSLPWKVTVIETGIGTLTGSRIAHLRDVIDGDFLLTYADGVANINIEKLIEFHRKMKTLVTLSAVQPPPRFGALNLAGDRVSEFEEKINTDDNWINGGFFVVNKEIFNDFPEGNFSFEYDVLPRVARKGELSAFRHHGFWQPVDTMQDLRRLDIAIQDGSLPWM